MLHLQVDTSFEAALNGAILKGAALKKATFKEAAFKEAGFNLKEIAFKESAFVLADFKEAAFEEVQEGTRTTQPPKNLEGGRHEGGWQPSRRPPSKGSLEGGSLGGRRQGRTSLKKAACFEDITYLPGSLGGGSLKEEVQVSELPKTLQRGSKSRCP
jgi:uncharacterized protein YjbI with pentapeptide repeats